MYGNKGNINGIRIVLFIQINIKTTHCYYKTMLLSKRCYSKSNNSFVNLIPCESLVNNDRYT